MKTLSLYTIPFAFPHLKHFLLMTQGWDLRKDLLVMGVDKCDYSFLIFDVLGCVYFFQLIPQSSSVLAPFCVSTNVVHCHICQLSLVYFPSSQCMGIVPTYTWKTHGSIFCFAVLNWSFSVAGRCVQMTSLCLF